VIHSFDHLVGAQRIMVPCTRITRPPAHEVKWSEGEMVAFELSAGGRGMSGFGIEADILKIGNYFRF
jgi:hypothetical protein